MKKKILLLFLLLPFLAVHGQEQKNWPIDSISKYLEFKYSPPKRFVQTFGEFIVTTRLYPTLSLDYGARWTSADGQCMVLLRDMGISSTLASGFRPKIDKSKVGIHDGTYNLLALYVGLTKMGEGLPADKKEKLYNIIKIWPEEKAKEWFNAQYVIEYPDSGDENTLYAGRHRPRRSLCIIKWEQSIYIDFFVTDKGYKQIDKYIDEFKKVFWYND